MKTLLIFAGQSTRFWPFADKCFMRIAGKTLLEHQVDRLHAAGLTDIVLVGGKHNLAQAKAIFPTLEAIEQEDLSLGMRGAFLSALPQCGDAPVLLVNSNDILDADAYTLLLHTFKKSTADGCLLARTVTDYFPGGYLTLLPADGKSLQQIKGKPSTKKEPLIIKNIVEKPGKGKEPSDLVNIVAHVHRDPKTLLSALHDVHTQADDGYEVALDALFRTKTYEAVPYHGRWQAIKYPWHLLELLPLLLSDLKRSIHKTARVHASAVIEGDVVLRKGVRVLAHATIVGPCVIGEETIIANNALVRGSSIGERCVIGYNTEIARSIVGNDVWTHSSYVGDSVIGDSVSFGAGTTTGNLRLDESEVSSIIKNERVGTGLVKLGALIGNHCRTGIHSCISPGVKIGKGSFIGSNILITQDIPDTSFVKQKNIELDIRTNTKQQEKAMNRESFRSKLGSSKKK